MTLGPRGAHTDETRTFNTLLDGCRRAYDLVPYQWTAAVDIKRTALYRYRAGLDEPSVPVLARLVRAAARTLAHLSIRASELCYLGEDQPLGRLAVRHRKFQPSIAYAYYDTRLDRYLLLFNIEPTYLARVSGVARQLLLKKRPGAPIMPSTLARLLIALRQMGYDVRASYLADVGDDELTLAA